MLALQERVLSAEGGPPDAGLGLVALARALLAAPPQLHRLKLLADFLLLMHQVTRRLHFWMLRIEIKRCIKF